MENKNVKELCSIVGECIASNGSASTLELLARLILGLSDSSSSQELEFEDLFGKVTIVKMPLYQPSNSSVTNH
tara:strand:- start:157 stop:375 length:219 start_codon:yes stop_codon:yes gene_type:complete